MDLDLLAPQCLVALGLLVDLMQVLAAILVDLMEASVDDLGENMVDVLEVLGPSMVEALGVMVAAVMAYSVQLAALTLMAILRTCLKTKMLMTTLLVLILRKMDT